MWIPLLSSSDSTLIIVSKKWDTFQSVETCSRSRMYRRKSKKVICSAQTHRMPNIHRRTGSLVTQRRVRTGCGGDVFQAVFPNVWRTHRAPGWSAVTEEVCLKVISLRFNPELRLHLLDFFRFLPELLLSVMLMGPNISSCILSV